MEDKVTLEEVEKFRRLGLLNECALRNMEVRRSYNSMIESGMKPGIAKKNTSGRVSHRL